MGSTANQANGGQRRDTEWSATMGWRYVSYQEHARALRLAIEPMASGPDVVYVPDSESWARTAATWAQDRREEILGNLKSIVWNRTLEWREEATSLSNGVHQAVPGSLESTEGGKVMESERFFDPGGRLTHEQAHQVWHRLAERFAGAAQGRVTIFATEVIENSVFQVVELPALRSNPRVTLDFK